MKAIEFRAWDKENNEMIDADSFAFDSYEPLKDLFSDDSFVFEQFTGLLDKNGTKIYEGDIVVVRVLHDGDDDAWVQPAGPAIPCIVSWDNYYKCFDFKGCRRIIHNSNHFEVIGNIHKDVK